MKESIYRKLVSVIHDYRTWIDVLDADRESTFSVQKGGELHPVHCRVLYLVAKVPNSVYPKGHVLSIPEYKLDSAVRSLKRNPISSYATNRKHCYILMWKILSVLLPIISLNSN